MRVIVIANRNARHLQERGPLLDAITAPDLPGVDVIETRTMEELDQAAKVVAEARPDAVVLAGGDGSYMAGVTAISRTLGEKALSKLPIALAPGGTAGTVARDWERERKPRRADATLRARAVFAALSDLRTTPRPTLRVRDGVEQTQQPRIGFIFGAGLVARFFEVYEREGANGERGAAKIVARIFGGSFVGGRTARQVLTPQECTVVVDGSPAPFDEVSLVAASVIKDLGLHMHLLHRAAERHDRFHVVATPALPRKLAPQMTRVLTGRPLRDPKIDQLAARLELRFPPSTGAYVLDGELLRSDRVEVTAGPVIPFVDVV